MALWILWFFFFAVVAIVIMVFMSYKIKVRIKDISSGNLYITFDRGKIKQDKRGKRYLSLLFSRKQLPTPPSNCIYIGKRGKRHIDYYRTEDDSYLPIKDNFDFSKYKKDNAELIRAHLDQVENYDVTLPALEDVYCPLTSEERVVFISELEASDSYKKKNVMDYLVQFAPYLAIVIILVIFVAFFGDVVKPIQEQGKLNEKILDKADQILERAAQIQDKKIEILEGELVVQPESPPN